MQDEHALEASSRCPMCGVDTPHKHSAQEVREYQEREASVEADWQKWLQINEGTAEQRSIRQAERWLRACYNWLLTYDYDMQMPGGVLDLDPLDIADRLAEAAEALSRQQAENAELRVDAQSAYARGYAAAVEDAARVARDTMVAQEWPPQDGDIQINEVLTAIRALVPGDSGAGEES